MFSEITVKKIQIEISNIENELKILGSLKSKNNLTAPDSIEIRSIAAILHSFYNGIENILKIILHNYNEIIPDDFNWHKSLLDTLSKQTSDRKFFISLELRDRLEDYLGFRHFFRHSYGFQLDWDLLKGIVENLDSVWKSFKNTLIS